MCVAGRRSEEVAAILDQPLQEERIAARVMPSEAIATKNLGRIDVTDVAMVCLLYLEPRGFTDARYAGRTNSYSLSKEFMGRINVNWVP